MEPTEDCETTLEQERPNFIYKPARRLVFDTGLPVRSQNRASLLSL